MSFRPIPELTAADMERFRSFFVEGSPQDCWPWQGTMLSTGFGKFKLRSYPYLANRVAFSLSTGRDLASQIVRHRCGNTRCVNPHHMFASTPADRTRAMVAKGTHRSPPNVGEGNPNARLSREEVIEIRASGSASAALAARYGVTPHHVRGIRRGSYRRAG